MHDLPDTKMTESRKLLMLVGTPRWRQLNRTRQGRAARRRDTGLKEAVPRSSGRHFHHRFGSGLIAGEAAPIKEKS